VLLNIFFFVADPPAFGDSEIPRPQLLFPTIADSVIEKALEEDGMVPLFRLSYPSIRDLDKCEAAASAKAKGELQTSP
jgi:hypothetical protein